MLACFLLFSQVASAAPYLPLPSWDGDSERDLETALWPGLSPVGNDDTIDAPVVASAEQPEPVNPVDPTLPLPVGDAAPVLEMRRPLEIIETQELDWNPVREVNLADYFANPPRSLLVNPQHLLSEPQQEEVLIVLANHAAESEIDIYALVFDVGQEASGGANLDNFAATWFPNQEVVVVAFYLGNPEATDLGASPALRARLEPGALNELRAEAVKESLVVTDHVNQLDRFCLRASRNLYWLERENTKRTADGAAGIRPDGTVPGDTGTSATGSKSPLLRSLFLYGILLAVLAGTGFWFFQRRRIEHMETEVLYFGNLSPARRLGAPYAGGTPVVVDFSEEG